MSAPPHELATTLRAEGVALFEANQRGRRAATATLLFLMAAIVVAAGACVAGATLRIALVLAPAVLYGISHVFQQFADVAVLGAARMAVEGRMASEFGDDGLTYELHVADIRQERPLVTSVRILQALTSLVILGAVAWGIYEALSEDEAGVVAAFYVTTALGALSAIFSYRDMLRSGRVATERLRLGERLSSR